MSHHRARTLRWFPAFLLLALPALPAVLPAQESQPAPAPKAPPAVAAQDLHPRVSLETSMGTIVLELDREKAPMTVENFLAYAQAGFYDGTIFHRVMSTFMIQGGGYTPEVDKKKEGMRPPIQNEWKNGLRNDRGTIAMARLGGDPNSATCEFFINVVDNARLSEAQGDGAGYAVFGKVVEGMDVVEKIRNTEVTVHPKYPGGRVVPKDPVIIRGARVAAGGGAAGKAAPPAPPPPGKPEEPPTKPKEPAKP